MNLVLLCFTGLNQNNHRRKLDNNGSRAKKHPFFVINDAFFMSKAGLHLINDRCVIYGLVNSRENGHVFTRFHARTGKP
jgi:hypothetical protein